MDEENRTMTLEKYTGGSLCIFCGSPAEYVIKYSRHADKGGVYRVNHMCKSCYYYLKSIFKNREEEKHDDL